MLNVKLLHKITGSLLVMEAMLMLVCLMVSLYYNEGDIIPFLITVIITAIMGVSLRYISRDAENTLGRRDAYLLVTSTWVIFSIFGMLPFLFGGYITNITDAFFETISGFTTTGATIIDDVEKMPHGLLFWRTMTQWIGGLGIVFFTIALLPSLVGKGSVRVFAAESTGPIRTKLHPRLSSNSHAIWTVYIVITMACATCYYLGGMSLFDCINYSMTTTATGGFATHNMSTEFFNSPMIEYTGTFFCFLSGVNFTLLYCLVMKLKIKDFFRNAELRFYVSIMVIATILIMYSLMSYNHYDLERAFRYAIFQVVSFTTSTGLFSDDAAKWHHTTWIILAILMFVGGCAGSTAGGFKSIRVVMLLKLIRNELKRILHPNAVLPVRISGTPIPTSYHTRMLAFLALYLLIFLFASAVIASLGIDVVNSITISISCLSNVGPTLGVEIGPTMSWADLPAIGKWFCSVLMLLGRLEIFSVLILFTREFWKNQ